MGTRKVKYYEWRKVETGRPQVKVLGGFGEFHQFGCAYEEFEEGPGNYTTAVIELTNGEIITPEVNMIKFMDKG